MTRNAPLYAREKGLTKKQKIDKEDTSTDSLPTKDYWNTLVPNVEIVHIKTNPYMKNTCVPPVAENEAEFILVKNNFQYASVSLC